HVRSIEYVVWRTGTAGDRTYTSTVEFASAAELRKDLAPGAKADSNACRSTSYGDPLTFSSSTLSGLSRSPHARTVTCSSLSITLRAGRRLLQSPISKPPPSRAS
ncbi:unnamed protein product, partial [Aphanomyces euteiches]